MSAEPRALHLATGDASSSAAIDDWLKQQSVSAVICHEALDAVTLMLTEADFEPACVFVGTEWLASEEHDVLDYLRAQWPRTWICIYGRGGARLVDRGDERMLAFEELTAMFDLAQRVLHPSIVGGHAPRQPSAPPRPTEPDRRDSLMADDSTELSGLDVDVHDQAADPPPRSRPEDWAWPGAAPVTEYSEPSPAERPTAPAPRPASPPPPNFNYVPPIVLDSSGEPPPAPRARGARILTDDELTALLQDNPDEHDTH